MRRAAMLHLKAVMNMGPRFLGSVVALSLAVMSAPSIAADSVANVEWAAATVGFAKDGKAHGGICTDKKSESVAASCALKAFKDAGGITLSSSQAWNCKGYSAAAMASNGGTGIASCKPSMQEAENTALTLCIQAAEGHDDCKIILKKSDLS